MSRWLGIVLTLFLEAPGILLWLTGGVVTIFSGIAIASSGNLPDAQTSIVFVAAILIAVIGYLMMAAHDLLARGSRFHVRGEFVPRLLTMELVVQVTIGLSFCFMAAAPAHALAGRRVVAVIAFILWIAALWGFKIGQEKVSALRKEGEADPETDPLPGEP